MADVFFEFVAVILEGIWEIVIAAEGQGKVRDGDVRQVIEKYRPLNNPSNR
jgi:hypothetical protein